VAVFKLLRFAIGWRVLCGVIWVGLVACTASTSPPTPTPQLSPTPVIQEVILTTGEWSPYTSESLPEQGAFTELVSVVLAEMGVTPKYLFYPWKRAEEEVRSGTAFAAFPYVATDERRAEFDFSEALLVSTGKFFYSRKFHPDPITYEKLEELQAYRIGGVLGYWYEPVFKAAGLRTDYVKSDEQNLEKLQTGRIDLAPTDELLGWTILKQKYPTEITQFATVEKPLNESALRLMVSRTYPEAQAMLEKFNAALQTLKTNGRYAQLLAKYGLVAK